VQVVTYSDSHRANVWTTYLAKSIKEWVNRTNNQTATEMHPKRT
jgi:hypothetical protein